MPLASSSAVVVRYIKEATFGVIPVTGNPTELRVLGETLNFNITKDQSKEINVTRTIASVIPTDASASGGITGEVSYQTFESLMESTLQGTWNKFGTLGLGVATATTNITTTVITAASATSGSSIFTNLQLGQWVRIVSAGVNSGKIVKLSSSVAPTTTVLTLDASTPAIASTGESIQIQAARLTHGTTQSSWTMERFNSDISVYIAYTGLTPSKMSLKLASGSLSSISFDFMGKSASEATATQLPGTPVTATNYDVQSGVSGATNAVWEGGAPVSGTFVKSVSLDYDNTLRNQGAIGTLGAVGIGSGTIVCNISMEIYFADKNLFTKFKNNSYTSLVFASTDASGNGYIFTIPVAAVTDWKSNASGKDNDQLITVTFAALRDANNAVSGLQKAIFIDRIGAAV
jgi:Phage tail tube protein